jgi:hypothetical protein
VLSEQATARSLKLDDLGFEREGLERRGVWKGGLLISRRTVVLLFQLVEKRWVLSILSFRTQSATRNRGRFAGNVVGINALYIP